MVITRFGGCKTALAFAVSSALAGCSAMDQASGPNMTANQPTATAQADSAADPNAPQVADMAGETAPVLEKSGRIHIASLPTSVSVTEIQTAALASSDPAPQPVPLAIAPITDATNAAQAIASAAPVAGSAPATSTILASATPAQRALSTKSGRIVQPQMSAGPVANEAMVTTAELPITAEMIAVQSVVPTPKPAAANMMLAYAGPNDAVSGMMNTGFFPPAPGAPIPETADASNPQLNKLITRYAGLYGVPESLVHRVVHRESKYDPKAYHKNGYWGLMQIKYSTAKSMGYDGPANGLLDAETNLKYAIKYLRGAWLVAGNKNDEAIKLYARGYYFDAKRKNMLHVLQ